MRIGFLGVGTIASHVIEGFCGMGDGEGQKHSFLLSPRNEKKSAALAEKHGNCRVCASNQEVVDGSDIIFIAMNASSCPDALLELNFREDHRIINLVATIPPEEIKAAVEPAKNFSHIVPLPFVETRIGPIAAYPESVELYDLISSLGRVVFTKNMDEIRALQGITSLFATFYETLHHMCAFAEGTGMEYKTAMEFTASFFGALCERAGGFGGTFRDMAMEMTPGGLNEFCLRTLEHTDIIQSWARLLPELMRQIRPS